MFYFSSTKTFVLNLKRPPATNLQQPILQIRPIRPVQQNKKQMCVFHGSDWYRERCVLSKNNSKRLEQSKNEEIVAGLRSLKTGQANVENDEAKDIYTGRIVCFRVCFLRKEDIHRSYAGNGNANGEKPY
jgi:hypothetical protein